MLFFYLFAPAGPRSTAAAVVAKNMPPAYFLYATTVLKEIIFSIFTAPFLGAVFIFCFSLLLDYLSEINCGKTRLFENIVNLPVI